MQTNSDRNVKRFTAICLIAGSLALALALALFAYHNFTIRAFSDPMNWIHYARNFAQEFGRSKWAAGFAFFLKVLLPLTGSFYIFLVNLPVLILLFLAAAGLTSAAARTGRKLLPGAACALGTLALILAFDPDLILFLINPYRDPLSHLFLFGSLLCLVAGAERQHMSAPAWSFLLPPFRSTDGVDAVPPAPKQAASHPWRDGVHAVRDENTPKEKTMSAPGGYPLLALSGLLLGLAYCVRETAILILPAVGFFLLVSGWPARKIGIIRSVLWFGVFCGIGCLPLIVQSWISTGQAFLPPQSVKQGTLAPGVTVAADVFRMVTKLAARYYGEKAGLWGIAAFVLGLVFAVVRRNRILLSLILPILLTYAAFYSFYPPFVRRYFYVVSLLAIVVATYGLFALLDVGVRRLREERHRRAGHALLALLLCLITAGTLIGRRPPSPPFQIPQARQLRQDLEASVPANAPVLCPRNLCEIIRAFTRAPSYPVTAFLADDPEWDVALRSGLDRLRREAPAVYVMAIMRKNGSDDDVALVRKLYNLSPVRRMPAADYHLDGTLGCDVLALYRVEAWTQTEVTAVLPPLSGDAGLLRLDSGMLWNRDTVRARAELLLNDKVLDPRLGNGGNCYFIESAQPGATNRLTLKSDAPLPSDIGIQWSSWTSPLVCSFELAAQPSCAAWLSGDFTTPEPGRPFPRLFGHGEVWLPALGNASDLVFAEFRVVGRRLRKGGMIGLRVQSDVSPETEVRIPQDRRPHGFAVQVRSGTSVAGARTVIRVDTDAAVRSPSDTGRTGVVDFTQVVLHRVTPGPRAAVNLGAPDDVPFVWQGWHERELWGEAGSMRWTAGPAQARLYLEPTAGDYELTVLFKDMRPEKAPASGLRFVWNGHPLDEAVSRPAGAGKDAWSVCRARVPAEGVARTNLLDIVCAPWSPAQVARTGDTRALGVMVHRIELTPRGLPREPHRPQ